MGAAKGSGSTRVRVHQTRVTAACVTSAPSRHGQRMTVRLASLLLLPTCYFRLPRAALAAENNIPLRPEMDFPAVGASQPVVRHIDLRKAICLRR